LKAGLESACNSAIVVVQARQDWGLKLAKPEKTICGIIMPISNSDDEHTDTHWLKVKDIVTEAISQAGCIAQPVWEGGAHDIIQAKILQNIYENPIVVCDLSTRNPNVMLEIGMRLTTKKPTLLIAEEGTSLPFDTGIIHTEFYNRHLEYRTTREFIERLAQQIGEKLSAYDAGEYHPYLEAFQFETVQPSIVSVSSEERLTDLVSQMRENIARFERTMNRDQNISKYEENWAAQKFVQAKDIDPENHNFPNRSVQFTNHHVGARVFHLKFGEGKVIHVDGSKVTVDFDNAGQRRVINGFLKSIEAD
jgi:hypothetical protein